MTIASVLAVLCLSANTSFVDFPRLCRLIAKDDFLPRSFAAIGRRLVYSVGVLFLAAVGRAAAGGVPGHHRQADPPVRRGRIPRLHALPVRHGHALAKADARTASDRAAAASGTATRETGTAERKRGRAKTHLKLWVNGVGAAATATALAIILAAKFTEGAWITILAIPLLLTLFRLVHRHYALVEKQVECPEPLDVTHNEPPVVLVPIRRWDRPTGKSLRFGMHLSADVVAVHLSNLEGDEAEDEAARMRREWAEQVEGPARGRGCRRRGWNWCRRRTASSSRRSWSRSTRSRRRARTGSVAVIIPEVVEKHWWEAVLHSRRASRLRNGPAQAGRPPRGGH